MPMSPPDALCTRLYALFMERGRRTHPRLDEYAADVLVVLIEHCLNPETSTEAFQLAMQADGSISQWFEWRARDIARRWRREDHEELSEAGEAIQWRQSRVIEVGEREPGAYIGTEEECLDLFRRVEQTGQPIAEEIHAIDLQRYHDSLDADSQLALRKKLSGFSERELGEATNRRLGRGLKQLRAA